MEKANKKKWAIIISVIVAVIVVIAVILDNTSLGTPYTVTEEEMTYTYYYSSNSFLPDKRPTVKITVKNKSSKTITVYGNANIYRDGNLYCSAVFCYTSGSAGITLAGGESGVLYAKGNVVSRLYYDNYEWTYKITSLNYHY